MPRTVAFFLTLMTVANYAIAEERGSLRGIALNKGVPLANAIVELYSYKDDQCKYSGKTNSDGAFQIKNIQEGTYSLEIKAIGVPARMEDRIRITANYETNLGYLKFGEINDYYQPRTHSATDMGRPVRLPCIEGLKILRDYKNDTITIENEELLRRAIRLVSPKWPKEAVPGYDAFVFIGIGQDGRVMCADVADPTSPIGRAVISAALQCRFQPVLEKGEPISAIGVLEFEVP